MNERQTRMVLGGRWREVEGRVGLDLTEDAQSLGYEFVGQEDGEVITSLSLRREKARGKWMSSSVLVQGTDIFLTGNPLELVFIPSD